MSTRDYNLSDYGFVITKEAAAYIVLALDRKEGAVPNDVQKLLDENKFREVAKNHMRNLPEYYDDDDLIFAAVRDLLQNERDFQKLVKNHAQTDEFRKMAENPDQIQSEHDKDVALDAVLDLMANCREVREKVETRVQILPEYYADYDTILDALRDLLENDERIVYAPEFTGTAKCILHEHENQTFEYDDEYLIYIQTEKEPSLFSTAYPTQDSLIEEYKTQLKNILPEDFDYAGCIARLEGVYYS